MTWKKLILCPQSCFLAAWLDNFYLNNYIYISKELKLQKNVIRDLWFSLKETK